jgi:hypothetical protein
MDLFCDHLALRVLLFLRERIEVRAIIVKAISLKPFATANRTGAGTHDSERPGEDANLNAALLSLMHRKRLTIDSQAARLRAQESVRLADRTGIAFKNPMFGGQRLVTRGSLGASASVAGGTQSFHLSAQHNHSRRNAFVFLRGPGDCPINRPLVDKALKPFISSQAQHLFAAAGRVSLPQIEQNNFE